MNKEEFGKEFEKLEKRLLYIAHKRCPHDPEGLVQEAAEKAWKAIDSFEDGSNFQAWVSRILINASINRYRRRKYRLEHNQEISQRYSSVTEMPDLEVDFDERIMEALNNMNPIFVETILHVDLNDKTYEEAAKEMGVPIGTVMSRLYRGRHKLRNQLEEVGKEYGLV